MTARYAGLTPASPRAAAAARGSSRKRDTRPELALRRAVFARGLRYRCAADDLPGRPDLVFRRARVVVFCDGDFWHGRDLAARRQKLERGHNAPYWVAKIESNVARDRRTDAALAALGWTVLRYWESDIKREGEHIADEIRAVVVPRSRRGILLPRAPAQDLTADLTTTDQAKGTPGVRLRYHDHRDDT